MKKKIRMVVVILLALVLAFSGWKMAQILLEYEEGSQVYASMEDYISIPETQPVPGVKPQQEPIPEPTQEEAEKTDAPVFPQVDFEALQAQNPDVVGWIYIPDTKINYPVLQGESNDTYLHHLMTGAYNASGSIFLEAGIPRDFSSQNNPVYGHNMKNSTMFAMLTRYKRQAFYEEHPVAYLMTPEWNYVVRLFSGYVTDVDADAWDTWFAEGDMQTWLDGVCKRSGFTSDVIPTAEDRILTLSTCSYETDDARFVVHGILEPYQP